MIPFDGCHRYFPLLRTTMTDTNKDLDNQLPLSPAVFHILMALADEDLHGYGIMQEVKSRTEGQVTLMPGTLYGAIKRLLKRGMVEEVEDRVDLEMNDERRRYYHLTDNGMKVLRAEVARLNSLVLQAQKKKLLPRLAFNMGIAAG